LFANPEGAAEYYLDAIQGTGYFSGLETERSAHIRFSALTSARIVDGEGEDLDSSRVAESVLPAAWTLVLTLPVDTLNASLLAATLPKLPTFALPYRLPPEHPGDEDELEAAVPALEMPPPTDWFEKASQAHRRRMQRYVRRVCRRWTHEQGEGYDALFYNGEKIRRAVIEKSVEKMFDSDVESLEAVLTELDDKAMLQGFYRCLGGEHWSSERLERSYSRDERRFIDAALENPVFFQRRYENLFLWLYQRAERYDNESKDDEFGGRVVAMSGALSRHAQRDAKEMLPDGRLADVADQVKERFKDRGTVLKAEPIVGMSERIEELAQDAFARYDEFASTLGRLASDIEGAESRLTIQLRNTGGAIDAQKEAIEAHIAAIARFVDTRVEAVRVSARRYVAVAALATAVIFTGIAWLTRS
jgi:hypothetical protein